MSVLVQMIGFEVIWLCYSFIRTNDIGMLIWQYFFSRAHHWKKFNYSLNWITTAFRHDLEVSLIFLQNHPKGIIMTRESHSNHCRTVSKCAKNRFNVLGISIPCNCVSSAFGSNSCNLELMVETLKPIDCYYPMRTKTHYNIWFRFPIAFRYRKNIDRCSRHYTIPLSFTYSKEQALFFFDVVMNRNCEQ